MLRVLPPLALLAATLPIIAGASTTPAALPLGSGPDRYALGTARTVASILIYSRWPAQPDPVRLCVVGPADHAGRLDGQILPNGATIKRRDLAINTLDLAGACDALYIGKLALPAMRQLTARVRGEPVLTIAESDPNCRSEAMFCLLYRPDALSFQMNLDAISRSAVRIDPRMLRMSRGY